MGGMGKKGMGGKERKGRKGKERKERKGEERKKRRLKKSSSKGTGEKFKPNLNSSSLSLNHKLLCVFFSVHILLLLAIVDLISSRSQDLKIVDLRMV